MYKICFVTTVSLTLKSFVLDFAKSMHDTGNFEIHFICDYDESFEKGLPDYIKYKPISMKRGVSLDGIKAMLEMYRYFKDQKFDLVQYSTPNASCYASIAAKMANIPNRLYCQWGIAYVGFHGLKKCFFKTIEKMVCRNSTVVEPDSFGNLFFSHKEKLYTAEKSHVIWNGSASGVNLKKFDFTKKDQWKTEIRQKYSIPCEAIVYVFIGRITRDKGVNELLESMRDILTCYDDVYLLLVGSVEHSKTVHPELYEWSQNETKVIYCGYTSEVEKYLAASDVYLLPSYREGFGSAVVEAEAMGIPVIVTDIPGPTDAMKSGMTGLVIPKGDAKALRDGMLRLYEDEALRTEYGHKAVEFASGSFEQTRLFEYMISDRVLLITKEGLFD